MIVRTLAGTHDLRQVVLGTTSGTHNSVPKTGGLRSPDHVNNIHLVIRNLNAGVTYGKRERPGAGEVVHETQGTTIGEDSVAKLAEQAPVSVGAVGELAKETSQIVTRKDIILQIKAIPSKRSTDVTGETGVNPERIDRLTVELRLVHVVDAVVGEILRAAELIRERTGEVKRLVVSDGIDIILGKVGRRNSLVGREGDRRNSPVKGRAGIIEKLDERQSAGRVRAMENRVAVDRDRRRSDTVTNNRKVGNIGQYLRAEIIEQIVKRSSIYFAKRAWKLAPMEASKEPQL